MRFEGWRKKQVIAELYFVTKTGDVPHLQLTKGRGIPWSNVPRDLFGSEAARGQGKGSRSNSCSRPHSAALRGSSGDWQLSKDTVT